MAISQTRDYHHPYKPYDIQVDLMNVIFDTIEQGKVGIFESPTGTGKSLSLICSSSTWLRHHQKHVALDVTDDCDDTNEPSWVKEQAAKSRREEVMRQHSVLEARLKSLRDQRRLQNKHAQGTRHPSKKIKQVQMDESREKDELDQFELEDYESDKDGKKQASAQNGLDQMLSSSSVKMMEQLGLTFKSEDEDITEPAEETKIFYCSRTHSQLQQFVHELRRVKIPAPWWSSATKESSNSSELELPSIKHISLGSRKALCIHPKVSNLGSASAINEKCLELQQSKVTSDKKCPYIPKKEDASSISEFRDNTMATIHDIEEAGGLGRQLGTCPYYGSRASASFSEIITLPYPLLLSRSAREALGLTLKHHVVVIDEAHNLMDTVSNIHSSSISLSQLQKSRSALQNYLQKFRNRLKGKNRVYIAQLVRLIDSLVRYATDHVLQHPTIDGIIQIRDLLEGKGLDQINLGKLMIYLHESKLARKVEGYIQYEQDLNADHANSWHDNRRASPVLTEVQSFLQTLDNPAEEGLFFFEKIEHKDVLLKYMLLDPTWHFKDIVDEARSVILLGGTMSPMEDYGQYLFPYLGPDQIRTWSCGHIIPKQNLMAFCCTTAWDGSPFDFTFERRNSVELIKSLGMAIANLASCIPDGVVVFFPSYSYLNQVVKIWQSKSSGVQKGDTIWQHLEIVKPIFQESKTANVDEVLTAYTTSIDHSLGGLLLSVVGGKLSEGINFSDALGRGIIVVGLPFPNAQSAQWKAKMKYVERAATKQTGDARKGKEASRSFYENACMRAVNQSIGRAIRHRQDYACIILLDRRYTSDRIQAKLPQWILQGMMKKDEDLEAQALRIRDFFAEKKAS